VLVVDDNVDSADMIAEALTALGHSTRAVYDGPSALAAAGELAPEVALVDLGLPGMSGLELAGRLRDAVAAVRLIAVTGRSGDHDRAASHAAGFDAHLVKPVRLADLAARIADLAP